MCFKYKDVIYVKSVRILSFSGPYFLAFGLNKGKYGPEELRIRTLITVVFRNLSNIFDGSFGGNNGTKYSRVD